MTSRSSQNPPVYTLPQHGVSAKAFKGKRQLRQSSVTVPRQEQSSVRTGRGRGERRGHTAVKVCDVLRAGQAGNQRPARRPLVTGHWSLATGRRLARSQGGICRCVWQQALGSGHGLSRLYFQLRHAAPQTSRSRGSRGPQSRPESARASFGKCSGPRARADGGASWPGRARSPCSGEKTGTGRRRRGCSQAGQSRNPSPLAASCSCNPAVFVQNLCTYRQLPSYKRPV